MTLTPAQRTVLADVRDELARDDPLLAASFGRLGPRAAAGWWLVASVAGLGVAVGGVELLGLAALGALTVLLVLAAPVVVAVAGGCRGADGPPEAAGRRRARGTPRQKEPPRP